MIIGRLTRDPEARTTPGGQQVTTFSVATGFQWKDKSGQKKENTEFHNVVTWNKLAEICAQYLKKGMQVYIEGRLQTRNWEGKDGVKRYTTEIIATDMMMLGSKASNQATANSAPAPTSSQPASAPQKDEKANTPTTDDDEISIEDIPF